MSLNAMSIHKKKIVGKSEVFLKTTIDKQRLAIKRIDLTIRNLMKMIKNNVDPQGIMNPGNCEVN